MTSHFEFDTRALVIIGVSLCLVFLRTLRHVRGNAISSAPTSATPSEQDLWD
jgi:hypothetical protein